jgi:hypothetical protein
MRRLILAVIVVAMVSLGGCAGMSETQQRTITGGLPAPPSAVRQGCWAAISTVNTKSPSNRELGGDWYETWPGEEAVKKLASVLIPSAMEPYQDGNSRLNRRCARWGQPLKTRLSMFLPGRMAGKRA